MDILTRDLWAHSTTDLDRAGILPTPENVTGHLTLYFGAKPGRDITAQISLAKLSGSGTARAYIEAFTKFVGNSDAPIAVYSHASGYLGELPWLLQGETSTLIRGAHSITFTLGVSNLFAQATCLIFVHPAAATRFTLPPLRVLGEMLGRLRRPATGPGDASPWSALEHRVIYDAQTGALRSVHHFAALTGAPWPDGSQLSAAAQELAERRTGLRAAATGLLAVSEAELPALYTGQLDVRTLTVSAT